MGATEVDEEVELLATGAKSAEWVERNFDKLAEKFEGKLIAVEGEEIIASSSTIENLIAQLEEKGKDPGKVYVTSFPPRDLVFIL